MPIESGSTSDRFAAHHVHVTEQRGGVIARARTDEGADERGMKMFVLCILKTGPKDAEIKGDERKEIFAGHFANIGRLADEGKLAVAGPFGKNDKSYRGLYIFNVATIEEAEKLVMLDPAVKAGVFVPDLTLWYGPAAMMVVGDTHKRLEKPKE